MTETARSGERIVPRLIEEEMKQSYLDYSMSVIVGRALPDVRDGLKPVHRRILFGMHELGVAHNKPFKKSARIVGEVMGKYHPHGDSSVYDALVRLAQDFSMRYPLVDGQGNFGSIDGESAAAMRYTEARLQKAAEEMLQDIDKETVPFVPNFDASLKEPTVLPSKIPNLLLNGSSGIAVGMATNIPPHNMRELCLALAHMIEKPECSISDLMKFVPAPDFPTGGLICGRSGVLAAYQTGKGKITLRGRTELEETKQRSSLIITEIPYMVNKTQLIEQIAESIRDKHVKGVTDLRDESDRDGMRIVLELKQGANQEVLVNQLFKHTRLQVTFGVIMLALVDNAPQVLPLRDIMRHFLDHRFEMVTNRTAYDLRKAEERSHILEGLIIALNDIDAAIKVIKQSKDVMLAKTALMAKFKLDEIQSQAILDMKLQRLTSLEQDKIREEQKGLLQRIAEYKEVLADEKRVYAIIKQELHELAEKNYDQRRTQILDIEEAAFEDEDLIKEEEMVVTVSHAGYVKRIPIDTYKQQKRGGVGIKAAGTRDEDFIEQLFIASTHDHILFFTNKGKVQWLKVHQIPQAGRQAMGTAIVNLFEMEQGEQVTSFVPVKKFEEGKFVMMATKRGIVKKTPLMEFSKPRKGGIRAIFLLDDDQLIDAVLTDGNQKVLLATGKGLAIAFKESDVREMGRAAQGVRGIKLKGGDEVIDMVLPEEGKTVLTLTKNGYGKRTPFEDYRLINRGGVGVINLKVSEKTGKVSAVKLVNGEEDIVLISNKGIIIRCPVKGISIIGRSTQGVRVMKLREGDELIAAAKIVQSES